MNPNAIPGKANRLNGRLATRVLLGFAECARFFPPGKCEVTGTPIRASLKDRIEKSESALAAFGLDARSHDAPGDGRKPGRAWHQPGADGCAPRVSRDSSFQVIHLAGKAG